MFHQLFHRFTVSLSPPSHLLFSPSPFLIFPSSNLLTFCSYPSNLLLLSFSPSNLLTFSTSAFPQVLGILKNQLSHPGNKGITPPLWMGVDHHLVGQFALFSRTNIVSDRTEHQLQTLSPWHFSNILFTRR